MARQQRTRQPKTKFKTLHKMKCASCGIETPQFKLVTVAGRVLAYCDPRHVPSV